jgi:hypothetical protein
MLYFPLNWPSWTAISGGCLQILETPIPFCDLCATLFLKIAELSVNAVDKVDGVEDDFAERLELKVPARD